MNPYKLIQHPKTKLWYVFGYCGKNPKTNKSQWMQISEGFKNKSDAMARMQKQIKADASAKQELETFNGTK